MAENPRATTVVAVLLVWLLAAVLAGIAGLIAQLQPPAPQGLLLAITLLSLGALWFVPPIRRWAQVADPRIFVAFHLTRFVGIYFLVLYRQGVLPFAFAVPGGWGDIAIAAFAVVLLIVGPATGTRARAYVVWNVLGLVDILMVVATAARLTLTDPTSMGALVQWPLSLLITFVVPIIIATHVWLFRRLGASGSEPVQV